MKTAFFFDTVLLEDEGNDFYGMTLTYDFFKNRYLDNFEHIVVSTRVKNKDKENGNISGYRKTNGENVEVKPIKSYKDIPDAIKNRKKIECEVDEILNNVDTIIVRMPSIIGMFACDSAKKKNKPYMIEMVACPWDGYTNHTHWAGKLMAPIMWYLNKRYIKNAPKVLYVTNKFLQKRYPTKGEAIACSDVVLNEFDDTILQKRLEKINSMKNVDVVKIGTIASVGLKYKGQEFVMKAMAKLKKQGKKFEYYLAGGGDDTRLKKIAINLGLEKEVHFLGSLPHNEVFELIDNMDIYIQPSLQEGLPRALIEAMSRACPAIGASTGGIPELLDEKFIFKKKSVNELTKILMYIEIDELKNQSIKNLNKAEEFNNKSLNEKRNAFYKNI